MIAELIFTLLEDERKRWKEHGLVQKFGYDDRYDPIIWTGPPDEEESAPWRALRKTVVHDLNTEAPDLAPLHPSLNEYFNSCWFLELYGVVNDTMIELMHIPPGLELEEFINGARRYKEGHNGVLDFVPLGIGSQRDLLLVVDNQDGSVHLDVWDENQKWRIADSLLDMFTQMKRT